MRKRRRLRMVGKQDEVRALVCLPAGDDCKTLFAMSLNSMTQHTLLHAPKHLTSVGTNMQASSILPMARQSIAERAIEQNATHLLWIDSDMSFPADMLLRLMARNQPIIGINAMTRRPPFQTTSDLKGGVRLETTPHSEGLVEVERMGFGVVWHSVAVLESMPKPWFGFEYDAATGAWTGEDQVFCIKAKDAGFKLCVDQDLSKEVQHLGCMGFVPTMIPPSQPIEGVER